MKTNVFENAGRLTVEQLEKLKKKIPIRGLNNFTKPPWWVSDPRTHPRTAESWRAEPTLPKRMDKLLFWLPYLPPHMVAMGAFEGSHNDEAKRLLTDCFDLLEDLKNNLEGVTVVSKAEIERYKLRIDRLKLYLIGSGKILGLIQETEFVVCDNL